MSSRVVITGLGAVTPIGIGKESFWKALIEGKNGIERITHFDATDYSAQIAAEVKDFKPEDYMDKKDSKRMDHYTQFALAASRLAVEDAKVDLDSVNHDRFGVFIGSGIGGIETLHSQYEKLFDKGPSRISPFFIPMLIPNMAAGQVSIELKLHGPSICIATACATGTNCIGEAFKLIQSGGADLILAGGSEASITQGPISGFCAMKALCIDHNDDPAHASRPFDKNRSGFVMGEGAGVVLLENLEHAKARGAHIYAEITGYGVNCDAYHITSPAPHGEFQAKCMQIAIDDAGVKSEEIDYINAHGTSTKMNDEGESAAIKTVFGEHSKDMLVSSNKSMIGHLLGAAGGVECIATALTIENGIVPPTINYETPDEGMDLDYVPNKAKVREINKAISNSFGFGGHNACILLEKYSD